MNTVLSPRDAGELAEAIRTAPRVRARGAGSKPALSSAPDGTLVLGFDHLRGVVEYEPSEYTFTALAGTPVREIEALLLEQGQYLPFDPPFPATATLGGTVAAGLSGPGRVRYGGVRDFILGVRIALGDGRLVRGGGKVVKNAAGFDFPKLMVGSLGRLGALLELTFKVFPRPEAFRTAVFECGSFAEALGALETLNRSALEVFGADLLPPDRLLVRIGGTASALGAATDRLLALFERPGEVADPDDALWRDARELSWVPPDSMLLKVPLSLGRMRSFDDALASHGAERRYSAGGSLAWVAWPGGAPLRALEDALVRERLSALVISPAPGAEDPGPLINHPENPFLARIRSVLDAPGRFGAGPPD